MKKFNEDYTAGVLSGIPIFCVNRFYKIDDRMSHIRVQKVQYRFRFINNYGASIVEFYDRKFSGGCQYELAVLVYIGDQSGIAYDTNITTDVERGDAYDMHELLCRIENL